jgi:hypothetical protein
MRILLSFVLAFVLLPRGVFAKRTAPAKCKPVVHQGIRYVAPNDDGRRAHVEAWEIESNKKLWDTTVFTNRIDPKLEEDVQWVFIKELRIQGGVLVVTSERDKVYLVNVKTKRVIEFDDLNRAKHNPRWRAL